MFLHYIFYNYYSISGVQVKMTDEQSYIALLCLPCGMNLEHIKSQTEIMKERFVDYLESKQAAGICSVGNEVRNNFWSVLFFLKKNFNNVSLQFVAINSFRNILRRIWLFIYFLLAILLHHSWNAVHSACLMLYDSKERKIIFLL